MKKIIKASAFIHATNRSPIMVIEDGKIRSLERVMKEAIDGNLNDSPHTEWRWRYNHQPFDAPLPEHIIKTQDATVDKVAPYVKKIKITIEIED
jgi:hypothetical protein